MDHASSKCEHAFPSFPSGPGASLRPPAVTVAADPGPSRVEAKERPEGCREGAMQRPLLLVHRGGQDSDVVAWEARFARGMAEYVTRFCADDPPPASSDWAQRIPGWVEALRRTGAQQGQAGSRLA